MYIGPVGSLQNLISPSYGYSPEPVAAGSVHQLLAGTRRVDQLGQPRRMWSLQFKDIPQAEFDKWHALYQGGYGPAPFALIDPAQVNLLNANQSSGTDVLRDTTGFAQSAGGLTSSTAQASTGRRSLAWTPTATTQQVVTGEASAALDVDVPVVPSVSYTASVYARRASDAVSVKAQILWYDSTPSPISTSDSSGVALTTSFQRITVTGTAPSTAVIAKVALNTTAVTSTPTVYADDWQLEQAAAASTWRLGAGSPRVAFKPGGFKPTYLFDGLWDLSVDLVEL